MSTNNKDFVVKNGLVVQGATATVNGNNVLTTANSINDFADVVISDPQNNQVLTYINGNWVTLSAATEIKVSSTAPASPSTGTLWYDSDNGITYIYYDSYWTELLYAYAGPTGPTGPQPSLSSSNPNALGAASAGVSSTASRSDHVHPTTGLALLSGSTFTGAISGTDISISGTLFIGGKDIEQLIIMGVY